MPAGQWTYTVTPVFATNWFGAESPTSGAVTVAVSTLSLSAVAVKPGTSLTGTAAGYRVGEALRYRLDSPTGSELTGTLAGNPTPATVPAGGGGAVAVTVPSGTSDGAHTVYAVASPSGDAAAASIVVDGTAPPQPVLTLTPTAVSGDAVTFAYTEAEAAATVECRLDAVAFASCDSPVDYAGLTAGSHTFQVRATDAVGNVSTVTPYTWTVSLTVPTIAISFPAITGRYSDSGFAAGCGTTSTGDVCGTAEDDTGVTAVSVSLRRLGSGLYWNGTTFSASTETFIAATGTTDWTCAISASALTEGNYTLAARATDATGNLGYDSRTFTVDRTAPAAPTLTSVPPATSGPSATVAFSTNDATATFDCRLDGAAFTSCASPQTYNNLTSGSHTVAVRAVDGAGNTSASTSTTWTVDATTPTAVMTFPTVTSYNLAGWASGCGTPAAGDVCGTAGDVGSGLSSVAVSIRLATTNKYLNGSSFTATSETWLGCHRDRVLVVRVRRDQLPGRRQLHRAVARHRRRRQRGHGWVGLILDTAPPPTPQINQAPSDPSGPSAQFDFTHTEAGTGAACRLDTGAWTVCTPPVSYSGLSSGSHTFSAHATDVAGNVSGAVSYTWTVDVGIPSISFSFPSAGRPYNDTTYAAGCGTTSAGDLCGTASDPGGGVAGVAVSIQRVSTGLYWNGTSFASATEVYLAAAGTTSWSYALAATSFPAEGNYVLHARATDNVGLTAIDALTITIDRTGPAAPAITSGPSGPTAGSGTFTFTAEAGAGFECRLDAGSWAGCASPKAYTGLTSGSHPFDARAIDGAGNTGATTSRTWTVDATSPTISTTFPAASRYNTTTYNNGCGTPTVGDICGSTSDASSGVSRVEISVQRASTGLYLTGTTFSAASQNWITVTGTTSWSYALAATTLAADDTYTLVVRATDAVGNAGTASTAFVIDRTKPTGVGFTTTNVSTLRKLESGDTFRLTYSEPIATASIIAGWNGALPQNVVVRATNGNGSKTDKLTMYDASNTSLLPLGTIDLKRNDFVGSALTFGAAGTLSTLSMSGSGFTISLGTPSGATSIAGAAANVAWTPALGATDVAGNAAATTLYTETDFDSDF